MNYVLEVSNIDFSCCQLPADLRFMLCFGLKDGETICDGCSYTQNECPNSVKISCGAELFKNLGTPKHTVKAWCRECAKRSSVPIANIMRHGKPAIILECNHCKQRYSVYESHYIQEYIGFKNMRGDWIAAKINGGVSPQLKQKWQKEKNRMELWTNTFGYSEEEAKKEIKEMDTQQKERFKKYEIERQERVSVYEDERIAKKVRTKKELIEAGILVYDKSNKCFVNKETGEIVKL